MANKDVLIQIKAIDKTKRAFSGITKGLKTVAGAALNLKTAFVGVAGAAGIGLLISRSLDATDALAKTATRIGTTTEALSRLHFAADISGVSTETLNMAMQRFTRRTAEAARGTGEAKDAIRELGLNANDLLRLDLDEQMIKLADAFAAQEDPAEKVRLAMKLFDSEGVALIQTLDAGAAGLREMFSEAEALGAVMSTDAAKGVEDTKDAITRLKAIVGGVIDQFTAAFAPVLEKIVTVLKEMIVESADAAGGFKALASQMVGSMIGGFIAIVEGAAEMTNGIIEKINDVRRVIHDFQRAAGVGDVSIYAGMEEELERLEARTKKYIALTDNLDDGEARFGTDQGTDRTIDRRHQSDLKRIAELKAAMAALGADSSEFVPFGKVTIPPELQGILDKFKVLQEELTSDIGADGDSPLKKEIDAVSTLDRALAGAREGLKKFNSAQDQVGLKMEEITQGALTGFSDALTNAVMGTGNLKDAFKAMIANMISQLIQFFIIDKLTGGIASALFGVKKAVSGGGGGGVATPTARAIGGPVQAGSPYMVGERGPEMFVPNQSGSIVPNKKMGGGVTVINNVDARGSGADVDQKIKSAMAQTSQQTIMTIQDLMRRRRFV
jgi:uncharacterized protein YdbL (DUF1318 family)